MSDPKWDVAKYGRFSITEYSSGLLTEADLRRERERIAKHEKWLRWREEKEGRRWKRPEKIVDFLGRERNESDG